MQLGIFAKTFPRPTLEESLDAVASHGLSCVQFNMSCLGQPTLPDRVDEERCAAVAASLRSRGLTMAAISGTFNMIDPSPGRLAENLRRLDLLASACRWLDTKVITLCTGTLDPDDMWRRHPGNSGRRAWTTLVNALKSALKIADEHEVTLAIEPEIANVVDSACKARRLLDEIGSPWLKVVIDPANLFPAGTLPRMAEILEEAIEWLGPDIVLAHAKDLSRDGEAGQEAAGRGVLDFGLYLRLLRRQGYDGPLILHGLDESEVGESVRFLRRLLDPETDRGMN